VEMRAHVLEREQVIPAGVGEVWPFFADARNLEALTPPLLRFEVTTPGAIEMGKGTLIEYRLRVHGVRVSWRTRIDVWEPDAPIPRFVDRQLRGPYALWHHTHTFTTVPGGTLMRDRVRYRMPLGVLGALGLPLVHRDLARIFDFRRDEVARRFRGTPAS
jgi:ligand-binding SRPBCC domain-containing protein